MFFWFGFGSYASTLGFTTMRCPRCGRDTSHELHESGSRLSVFFIPIFKFGKRFILVCRECGSAQQIPESAATSIRRGQPLPSKNPFDLR